MATESSSEIGTVDRVLAMLKLVADSSGSMSVRGLSQALSLPPSTVHRLLEKFVAHDLVSHDKAIRRYRLGPEFYRLACLIVADQPVFTMAEPILQQMTSQSGEASVLGLLLPAQRKLTFTAKADPDHQLRYRIELNRPLSLVHGASGRAVLAHLPEQEIVSCIEDELEATASKTTMRKAIQEILADVESIRTQGYAFSRGARIPGAIGLAVPVRGPGDQLIGSVCVTVPEYRYDESRRESLVSIVREGGRNLSRVLIKS